MKKLIFSPLGGKKLIFSPLGGSLRKTHAQSLKEAQNEEAALEPCFANLPTPKLGPLLVPAVTRIRTGVAAATTQSTDHYTITASYRSDGKKRGAACTIANTGAISFLFDVTTK